MADEAIGLGAGLSGFAQGFASSFMTIKERQQQQELEENKSIREMLTKRVLDPKAPIDLSTMGDSEEGRLAQRYMGHAFPVLSQLSHSNYQYIMKARKDAADQAAAAAAAPVGPGEQVKTTSKDITTGATTTRTRSGGPALKSPEAVAQDVDVAGQKAQRVEAVREPGRERRVAERARQANLNAIRAERRQFRAQGRALELKLKTDPKTRGLGTRIHDFFTGDKPQGRLYDALQGIPKEMLPPELQQVQATPPPGRAATPSATAGVGKGSGTAASRAQDFLDSLSGPQPSAAAQ
jgi:hypothetical protein